ncbi:hypothetical protein BTN50_1120 [Candidatus Enterovibrio altilux]|uniref:Uncharacterized protein n=1 Tax=Candidatus Enterovibrio altilux TaxID=1927128 RepID=A0A291B9F1_9GAMM|nr:hypothetical protein BTN50_1120 [Candidatus Enterovibrio luxaltus]
MKNKKSILHLAIDFMGLKVYGAGEKVKNMILMKNSESSVSHL